jgi:hypothetical protein
VLLATTGIYILAKEVGPLARQLFLLFEIKAGGHAISDKAVERLPDETQIIATALCAVAGLLIAKESRRVASVILREKGQAQPPRQQ